MAGWGGGASCFTLCELCISKISDYYIYCSLLLATAQFFSIFIKLYVDDGGMFAAFSAQALAASMFQKEKQTKTSDSFLCNDFMIPTNLMIYCLISLADCRDLLLR